MAAGLPLARLHADTAVIGNASCNKGSRGSVLLVMGHRVCIVTEKHLARHAYWFLEMHDLHRMVYIYRITGLGFPGEGAGAHDVLCPDVCV